MLRTLFVPVVPSVLVLAASVVLSAGCDRDKDTGPKETDPTVAPKGQGAQEAPGTKQPSAKEARELTSNLPPAERVQSIVNPKKATPYSGKTGTVRGIVRATGDAPPELPEVLAKMDANCTTSRVTFGKLFREGPERELADVLVAVTGYEGFVPAKGTEVEVRAEGCAWDSRTIVMTFGQRLNIDGTDNRPYVPEILGQAMPAQLFVLPTAPPVQLPPKGPGRFKLVDSMRLYNIAEVFVLPYATAAVSNLDGEFEITGIPVGEVTVNALLPQTGVVAEKKVTVSADAVTEVEFSLAFDAKDWSSKPKQVPLDEIPGPEEN